MDGGTAKNNGRPLRRPEVHSEEDKNKELMLFNAFLRHVSSTMRAPTRYAYWNSFARPYDDQPLRKRTN